MQILTCGVWRMEKNLINITIKNLHLKNITRKIKSDTHFRLIFLLIKRSISLFTNGGLQVKFSFSYMIQHKKYIKKKT